ncbi:MAG: dihydroorotate dehydrogenase electron transfer subunit [Dehalococcoidales bacterium]|nr:dihydroorotate dehydrogenase electron transfer subunit [Dehalococcoidales bacterium]
MKQVSARVLSSVEALPGVRLIWLSAPEIALDARPGQFVMVRCGGDTILPRPFSIHRVANGELALLFKVRGRGTQWLARCKKGDTLEVFGALGRGYTVDSRTRNLLLVAGGLGIAPLYFLAERAVAEWKKVTIICGARTADQILPVNLPQRIYESGVRADSLHVVCATEDGSEGFTGPATRLIPHYLENIDQVFACGPLGMYRAMAEMPELEGKDVQVSLEVMMGCGVGACYGCTIRTKSGLKQVCRDGPVFPLAEIDFASLEG